MKSNFKGSEEHPQKKLKISVKRLIHHLGFEINRRAAAKPLNPAEFLSEPLFSQGLDSSTKDRLAFYLNDFQKIPGWFGRPVVKVMALIELHQRTQGIRGSVAEIGIQYGKSFLPLYILCDKNSRALAIDCFEEQQHNIDGSGCGDSQKLIDYLKKYGQDDLAKLRLVKTDSLLLDPKKIISLSDGEACRIFSIDGSHTADATERDLTNACGSLAKGGVIMIDDYFHPRWPGVSEGVNRFMSRSNTDLKPFFIGFNKVLLAGADHIEGYRRFMEAGMGKPLKESVFFGQKTAIY